jgi:hypothetical protein
VVHDNVLHLLKGNFLNRSLFTNCYPGRIYNGDPLHSLPAVILEALVYSRPGQIELLPAWPEQLGRGSVTNVGCRTQAKVKNLSWDLKQGTIDADIVSFKDQQIVLRVRAGFKQLDINGKTAARNTDSVSLLLKKDGLTKIRIILDR